MRLLIVLQIAHLSLVLEPQERLDTVMLNFGRLTIAIILILPEL